MLATTMTTVIFLGLYTEPDDELEGGGTCIVEVEAEGEPVEVLTHPNHIS